MTTEAIAGIAEMRGELTGINGRMDTMEQRVESGFKRIEDLLNREILELKQEQLSSLREENRRLADDQRRIWDIIHGFQQVLAKQSGGREALFSASHLVAAAIGGLLPFVVSWLTGLPIHLH